MIGIEATTGKPLDGLAHLGQSIGERVKDITDPKSTSMLAREYRGEFGAERQTAAQGTLHQLMANK